MFDVAWFYCLLGCCCLFVGLVMFDWLSLGVSVYDVCGLIVLVLDS